MKYLTFLIFILVISACSSNSSTSFNEDEIKERINDRNSAVLNYNNAMRGIIRSDLKSYNKRQYGMPSINDPF